MAYQNIILPIKISLIVLLLFCHLLNAETLRVLTENNPPYSYEINDKIHGFSTDIVNALIKETGTTVELHAVYPWARAYKIALAEKNILLYSVTRTAERETLFKWVGPIHQKQRYLFKLKNRDDIQLSSLQDAKSYVIGTERDSSNGQKLYNAGFTVRKNLSLNTNKELTIKQLYARRIDLTISNELTMQHYAKMLDLTETGYEKALELSPSPSYYLAFSQTTDDNVIEKFSDALEKMKADGRFAQLKQRYLF